MADPPLSERGKLQAENAALFLSIRDADSVSKRNVIFSFRIHTHISLLTNLHAHYQEIMHNNVTLEPQSTLTSLFTY